MDDLDYNYELLGDEYEKDILLAIHSACQNFEFGNSFSCDKLMNTLRKNIILMVLEKTSFNQLEAARFLGLPEPTFRYQMDKLQIPRAGKS